MDLSTHFSHMVILKKMTFFSPDPLTLHTVANKSTPEIMIEGCRQFWCGARVGGAKPLKK